jgi:transglutaminase-like putative cysteine protease
MVHLYHARGPCIWTAGILLAFCSVFPVRAQPSPEKHLEITGLHRLRITYDYTAVWPRGGVYSAVLRLPVPPDTGTQSIEHFSSSLSGTTESDENNHRILTATLHHNRGDDRELHWRVEIVGLFRMRQLVDGPPPVPAPIIVPPRPGAFLNSTESINWDTDSFQNWLTAEGLRRKAGEAAVDYASRLYDHLREDGEYCYPPETSWTAAAGCRALRTDCGGFSLIFTAACRANKIPARLLVGQWFKTRELSDGTLDLTGRQAHVIAEFFDPRIGWIPEDISSAFLHTRGFSDGNFFGRDPGYFFAWHTDTDFHFSTPEKADEHVQWIQNPSLWFSSDGGDSLSHHWGFESLPRISSASPP